MVKLCLINLLFDTFRSFCERICLGAGDYTGSSSVSKTTNTAFPQLDLFHPVSSNKIFAKSIKTFSVVFSSLVECCEKKRKGKVTGHSRETGDIFF